MDPGMRLLLLFCLLRLNILFALADVSSSTKVETQTTENSSTTTGTSIKNLDVFLFNIQRVGYENISSENHSTYQSSSKNHSTTPRSRQGSSSTDRHTSATSVDQELQNSTQYTISLHESEVSSSLREHLSSDGKNQLIQNANESTVSVPEIGTIISSAKQTQNNTQHKITLLESNVLSSSRKYSTESVLDHQLQNGTQYAISNTESTVLTSSSYHSAKTDGSYPVRNGHRKSNNRVLGIAMGVAGSYDPFEIEGHFSLSPDDLVDGGTLCLWVKPHRWYEFNCILYFGRYKVSLFSGKVAVSVHTKFSLIFEATAALYSWSHICVTISADLYELFFNGKKVELEDVHHSNSFEGFDAFVISNVTVQFSNTLYDFIGFIADPVLLPGAITEKQAAELRIGKIPKGYSMIYTFIINNTVGINITKSLTAFTYEELLQPQSNYMLLIFESRISYYEAIDICATYGGTLPVYNNTEHKRLIMEFLMETDQTMFADTWISFLNVTQTDVSSNSSCFSMAYRKKEGIFTFHWPCHKSSFNLMCVIPVIQYITLKGDDVGPDNQFIIVNSNGKSRMGFSLEGTQYLKAFYARSYAKITLTDTILYTYHYNNQHFLGRKEWISAKDRLSHNLTLSVCKEGEFTCGNGHCIPLSKRCDGHEGDCSDYTDDDKSCQQFRGPGISYCLHSSPMDPKVSLKFSLRRMNVEENNLMVVFSTTLTWSDNRLVFYDLRFKPNPLPNYLELEKLQLLWAPYIIFGGEISDWSPGGRYERTTIDVYLEPKARGVVSQIQSFEAMQYEGSNVSIIVKQKLGHSFECQMDLLAFPLDVQICRLLVQIRAYGQIRIDEKTLAIKGGEFFLPAYHVSPLRCIVKSNFIIPTVEVAVLLKRRCWTYMLSLLGPCVVLGMLGHISFRAFTIKEFSLRASTSLTLLVVVASLFSQSMSIMPSSPSPKAIDVWFFYFIFRFFLFFIAHCLVEHYRRRTLKKSKKNRKKKSKESYGEKEIRNMKDEMKPTVPPIYNDLELCQKMPLKNTWLPEDLLNKPATTSKTAPLISPEAFNIICLFLGILLDVFFFASLYYHIYANNANAYSQFDTYQDCFSNV